MKNREARTALRVFRSCLLVVKRIFSMHKIFNKIKLEIEVGFKFPTFL